MAESFNKDYESLSSAMTSLGLVVSADNFTKFTKRINGVDINVAAYIPTQKLLFRIGTPDGKDNDYTDNMYQYQVWAEKKGATLSSVSGGGLGSLDVAGIKSAVNDMLRAY